ncbi:LLM class F420-dependent oxidoreductase [Nonomuraea candida]|uniref:LLM class F420-dependent oxidoreductase n=1 Tax=Nonomuraea candida TaxID=359159 RepID=UPI0005BA71EB|nr:LLM class F420-dependent oxidoreductase [Nonomuraea candida]
MRLGAIFPHNEIGADPEAMKIWATAVEDLGYHHIMAFDHVLGAGTASRPGWRGYTSADSFHEVFVLFGYLAGLTTSTELVTGVLVLPQRQTALVAKQAAEVDILSKGRLRLGIGVGWNDVEYEALGQDFTTRGRRAEEQVEVLRALWAHPEITFQGRWHTIREAGINPRPVRGHIPVWFGGHSHATLRRVGRQGDGWLPLIEPGPQAEGMLRHIHQAAQEAGRNPRHIGIEIKVSLSAGSLDSRLSYVHHWRELGATHVTIETHGMGRTVHEHIAMLEEAAKTYQRQSW